MAPVTRPAQPTHLQSIPKLGLPEMGGTLLMC